MGIIVIQATLVVCFYGAACFSIISGAKQTKEEKELIMKEVCILHRLVISLLTNVLKINSKLRNGCNKMQLK